MLTKCSNRMLVILSLMCCSSFASPVGFKQQLAEAAMQRTHMQVRYDGAYRRIG